MFPPPRVGGTEFAFGDVKPEALAYATPIIPMKGLRGKRTAALPNGMTPCPSATAVKVETFPYLLGSLVFRPSDATGGITSAMLMPAGASPLALTANAPLPWRLDTTP